MGLISGTKNIVKRNFNVRDWVGYDQRKASWQGIGRMLKALFVVPEAKREESFEQAMERLGLKESDIKQREREFFRLASIFLGAGIFLLFYTVYLAWTGHFLSVLLSFVATLLVFTLSFRYHFWYFQTKNKKLGCTFDEWLNSDIKGSKQ